MKLWNMFDKNIQEDEPFDLIQDDTNLAAPFAEFEAVEDQLERIEKKIDKLMEYLSNGQAW